MADDYLLRPMRLDDVPAVERLTKDAFYALDVSLSRPVDPQPEPRPDGASQLWIAWTQHIVGTDPGGCFVAENDSGMIGAVCALRRETTWLLSVLAVKPGFQGRGVGRQLLAAALTYGQGCLRSMVAASNAPAATRNYRQAGFTLHPLMVLRGTVSRAALPVVERVREGSLGDVDLMDSVDRQTRDSAHGADHAVMAGTFRLAVVDRSTGQGYVYVRPDGSPYLLAATNRRTATDLLWEALASSNPDEPVEISHVTAANEWAIDVGMAARLDLHADGFLGLRQMKPPTPYLPSGRFL